jgi:hypothetical protein
MQPGQLEAIARLTGREQLLIAASRGTAMDESPDTLAALERRAITEALTGAGLRLTGTFAPSLNFRHPSGEPVQIVTDPEFDPMIDRAEPLDVAGFRSRVVTTADLIAMKERAAADPARRASMALRDRADVALLRGDVPGPDEGW